MTVYLVRHGQAGSRASYRGHDDRERRLTRGGRLQAADLVEVLGEPGFAVSQIRSSPFRRCIEMVAPLGAALGLEVLIDESLAEGPGGNALDLVRRLWGSGAVLCSHGDVIPFLLDALRRSDQLDLGHEPRCQKGSIWVLEAASSPGHFSQARYIAPPRSR